MTWSATLSYRKPASEEKKRPLHVVRTLQNMRFGSTAISWLNSLDKKVKYRLPLSAKTQLALTVFAKFPKTVRMISEYRTWKYTMSIQSVMCF